MRSISASQRQQSSPQSTPWSLSRHTFDAQQYKGDNGDNHNGYRGEDQQHEAVVRKLSVLSVYMQQHGSHNSLDNQVRFNQSNFDNCENHGSHGHDTHNNFVSHVMNGNNRHDNNGDNSYNGGDEGNHSCSGNLGCHLFNDPSPLKASGSLGAGAVALGSVKSHMTSAPLQFVSSSNVRGKASFPVPPCQMPPLGSGSERSTSPSSTLSLDSAVMNGVIMLENGGKEWQFSSSPSSTPGCEWGPSSVPDTFGNGWMCGTPVKESKEMNKEQGLWSNSGSFSSRNDDERGVQTSGSGAESPGTPKQPERPYGSEFPSMDTDSSSLSFSDSREDNSGASGDGKHDEMGDMEADSSPSSRSTIHLQKLGGFQKRSLSSHFNGKSRSFTSLADVAGIQSIQDLAKPENPYLKKRRTLHNSLLLERHRSFPLRSVDGTIHKKSSTKGGNGLAVALAMSTADGGNFMGTLTEDVTEGIVPTNSFIMEEKSQNQNYNLSNGGLMGPVKGVSGVALQDSWRRVWQNGTVSTPQKSSRMRRHNSKPNLSQMVE